MASVVNYASNVTNNVVNYFSSANSFNILGIKRYCCRRHLLSHTDLVDII